MIRLHNDDVVILAARRSLIGKFGGALKGLSAPRIAGPVIKRVLRDTRLSPFYVERVIMGNVLSAGLGQNPAQQAAVEGDIPNTCPAHSVNKVCASSLMALWDAYNRARVDDELVVAGGMESMSNSPYLVKRFSQLGGPGNKSLFQFGPELASIKVVPASEAGGTMGSTVLDSMIWDGLSDAFIAGNPHMGILADQLAKSFPDVLSREKQDLYAFMSQRRAMDSRNLGAETLGICEGYPIEFDEGVREPNLEKMSKLPPYFGDTITAGNASQLSDGAAALVVASYRRARALGAEPLAKIIAFDDYSDESSANYTTAPVGATEKVLDKAKMRLSGIDLFEVNEAFAVVPPYFMDALGVSHEKLNIWGGAIAMGHPIGASGARIVVTLVHALKHTGGRYGLAVACHGGGGAVAVIIENLQY